MALNLQAIGKRYGRHLALESVDLTIDPTQYTCIMGPSGAGKSTLLRIIAGLESPDQGEVRWQGTTITADPAEARPFRTVFQSHALFPQFNVLDNISFAGRIARHSIQHRHERALEVMTLVGLDHVLAHRAIDHLSGGEAQRVALARALYARPALLLLDEPLSALDRGIRLALRRELRQLQQREGLGFIHVTHDPDDALANADQLVIIDRGHVVAHGPPLSLYTQPNSHVVAQLLGDIVAIDGLTFRPESLRPVSQGGRIVVQERERARVGPLWEVHLQYADETLTLLVARLPDSPVCGLDWDDQDVLPLQA